MIAADTSVLIAATLDQHEHHAVGRRAMGRVTHLPAVCLAEVWSVLTRAFALTASEVAEIVLAWDRRLETFSPAVEDYRRVFRAGRSLGLGGNVHDAVVVAACESRDLELISLDQAQARLARGRIPCHYLLDPGT